MRRIILQISSHGNTHCIVSFCANYPDALHRVIVRVEIKNLLRYYKSLVEIYHYYSRARKRSRVVQVSREYRYYATRYKLLRSKRTIRHPFSSSEAFHPRNARTRNERFSSFRLYKSRKGQRTKGESMQLEPREYSQSYAMLYIGESRDPFQRFLIARRGVNKSTR